MFLLASGDSIHGQLVSLGDKELEVESFWQSRVKLPTAAVADIRFRNGRLTLLGDLEPIAVEEVGYFGRVIHWRRDQGFDDSPAKIRGKRPRAVWPCTRAACSPTPSTGTTKNSRPNLPLTTAPAIAAGRDCRVLVDGRELFGDKDFRSTQDPIEVEVPLAGAKQLSLEVDFGEGEDVGDRIIWAEPRLFRSLQK